jgi:hypothetical protein
LIQEYSMELQAARQIIDTLAQGIHPVTGETMSDDSPYNAPPVIRALFTISRALEDAMPGKQRRSLPPNTGKAWTVQEDNRLQEAFTSGIAPIDIAQELGRTRWAVESRLVKLGRLPGRGDVPFAATRSQ